MENAKEILTFEQLYINTMLIINNYKTAADGILMKYYQALS